MSFIKKRIINGTTYVYEITSYRNENGKVKTKDKILGKLDESGNLIPSKRRLASLASSEPKVEVNDKVPATPLHATPAIPEVIEVPICPPTAHLTESPANLTEARARISDTESESKIYENFTDLHNEEMGNVGNETEIIDASCTSKEVMLVSIVENKNSEITEHEIVKENHPQVISVKADHYRINTSKLDNIAFDPSKNEAVYKASDINEIRVNVSRSSKKRIDTLFYIDFNDAKSNGLDISHEDRLTAYDSEIHNAVATLAAAGNKCISPNMIFQLLSGNTSEKHKSGMSPETREKIVKSLNKMRMTNVKINASSEVKAGMILGGIIENYLIPAKRAEMTLNGQIIKDCIYLYDQLPLFLYASKKNQIASVDIKMLDTPLLNSAENIALKCYLIKRILSLSNEKNNMSGVIRYDTLYQYLNIQASNQDRLNHKHKQIREKVKTLLNFWKEKKFIKDYKEEKEGRLFTKVIIIVSKNTSLSMKSIEKRSL